MTPSPESIVQNNPWIYLSRHKTPLQILVFK